MIEDIMISLKKQEQIYIENEKKISEIYDSLIDMTTELIQREVENHITTRIDDISLEKSEKLKPIFGFDLFLNIEDIISSIIDPLKIIISKNDERLDFLEMLGLSTAFLTMHDVYRQAYRIQHEYSLFQKKVKHNYAWRKDALKWMEQNTGRHIDKHVLNLTADAIDVLKNATSDIEQKLYNQIKHKEKTKELVKEELIEAVRKRKSLVDVKQILKDKTKEYHRNWNLIVKTEFAMAKNVASVQSIEDIGSALGTDPKVAIVNIADERTSDFCHNMSREEDGTIKIVKLSDLKPAGYNLSKKPDEWKNSVPPRHFNCRCWIVYVPDGFTVSPDGRLILEN